MWLIETYTWKLRFFHNPPEKYAILSHAWAEEELTFQEFRSLEGVGGALAEQEARRIRNKKGFKKIQQCCHLALSNNLRLAWVDTCCIDKASSAELSESINSMFHWYKESTICYVYLEDVTSVSVTTKPNEADPYKPDEPSRWYTRGWTLQELLAPARVDFYNSSWQKIGSKWGLRKEIASITGIGELDLISYDRSRTSIAQKMSWASRRNTTRIEDAAYCLLGIFGIHMPLLYGERGNAFRRLQERLIQTSSDQSIFCWNNTSYVRAPDAGEPWGMLAGSPRDFTAGSFITFTPEPAAIWPDNMDLTSYVLTNIGLDIVLPVSENWEAARPYCRVLNSPILTVQDVVNIIGGVVNGLNGTRRNPKYVVAILGCRIGQKAERVAGVVLASFQDQPSLFYRLLDRGLLEVDPHWASTLPPRKITVVTHDSGILSGKTVHTDYSNYAARVFFGRAISVKRIDAGPYYPSASRSKIISHVVDDDCYCIALKTNEIAVFDVELPDGAQLSLIFAYFPHRGWLVSGACCAILMREVFEKEAGEFLDEWYSAIEFAGVERSTIKDGMWLTSSCVPPDQCEVEIWASQISRRSNGLHEDVVHVKLPYREFGEG